MNDNLSLIWLFFQEDCAGRLIIVIVQYEFDWLIHLNLY